MTWNFACRNCGHRDTYAGYPFKSSCEFPRCTRCGGQTYRPSLEDTDTLDFPALARQAYRWKDAK